MEYTIRGHLIKDDDLPEVGELWTHRSNDTAYENEVFIRVRDEEGKKCCKSSDSEFVFYSFSLKRNKILTTNKSEKNNIIKLKPQYPIMFIPK